ncbi:TRAM domain-containing protein [Tsukamurella sp. 8F]|uniref:class I SAM-dependent RNA methyltransferase n=1 Tax=unclassified Tsukamurella TaxID=2633480 RepID=UPI0023BA2302|nr:MULTISPECIES: TRAM domain-containing protein [unclassified Tsukamurella]MDF0531307.1 TRAM domain-containing protein [Tsukamurella sp. 8J]MDF0585256.1 TRAM domain-containing protein [Tsukamurella sp. 8F]
MSEGRELELVAGRPAHGGFTVARTDGQVVFVSGALPGEPVRARVTETRKSFLRATVTEVLTPSPHRVDEACPAAAAGAGCCDLSFAEPAYARELKSEVLADVLGRIGRFAPGAVDTAVIPVTPGMDAGWRTRARLAVGRGGELGWRAARSHDLVAEPHCRQLVSGLVDGLTDLEHGAPELVVARDDDGVRHAVLGSPARRGSWAAQLLVDGSGITRQRVGTRQFDVPVTAFWQAHRDAVAAYTALAARWVPPDVHVWDLYGGVGVFASALTERGGSAEVVETSPDAVRAGRRAFEGAPVRFLRSGVAEALPRLRRPGAVVLDPPRAGAGAETVRAIAAARPADVVHVGCDAAAFARDLRLWHDAGYAAREVVAFDAFPGTHHLEVMAHLTPGAAP